MSKQSENSWMGISDMMSGLMLIFLFIAISFMVKVESEKQEMEDVAIEYRNSKANLGEALFSEFEDDFQQWNATITNDNSIIFASPEVLFDVSSSKIKGRFKSILEDFFIRYINILTAPEFKNSIKEIRVEGHSSKSWKNASSPEEVYLKNMQLSQQRAYSVLSFCYSLQNPTISQNRFWLEQHFRANGIAYADAKEESKARRVEFRVTLKSEEGLYKILQ